jgi:hypothetical protein
VRDVGASGTLSVSVRSQTVTRLSNYDPFSTPQCRFVFDESLRSSDASSFPGFAARSFMYVLDLSLALIRDREYSNRGRIHEFSS